jgi:hypothetical protein
MVRPLLMQWVLQSLPLSALRCYSTALQHCGCAACTAAAAGYDGKLVLLPVDVKECCCQMMGS